MDARFCRLSPKRSDDFRIPIETLLAVLDGVEMDLVPRIYETFDELAVYCERVASAVGLACMHIWGFEGNGSVALGPRRHRLANDKHPPRLERRRKARTRLLAARGSSACGYTAEELRQGVVNEAFRRLMELEIERTKQFYREANDLLPRLHRDGRRVYGLMMDRYYLLLAHDRMTAGLMFFPRIRLSRWQKLLSGG